MTGALYIADGHDLYRLHEWQPHGHGCAN